MSDKVSTAIYESDLNGIRSATQWLLGSFGGIGLVVITGVHITDIGSLFSEWSWRPFAACLGILLVGVGLVALARAAARVLVPDRTDLTDLITNQARDDAAQFGVMLSGAVRQDSSGVYKHVREEIGLARGWLLPSDCEDLDAAYQKLADSSGDDAALIRDKFREIMAFARTQAALYRYDKMLALLIGWCGLFVVVGLILLGVALTSSSSPHNSSIIVDRPFSVKLYFSASASVLASHGISPSCASAERSGVAIGGTLAEPQVIISGTKLCPTKKIVMTDALGVAVPVIR